jgi:heme-degrading monooxygenase HmoA
MPKANYLVFFKSKKNHTLQGYEEMFAKLKSEVKNQAGYLGFESYENALGETISISYWKDLESIYAWRANENHIEGKLKGVANWYDSYEIWITRVEHHRLHTKGES